MTRADRIAICASFVVTSSLGVVFLLRYWQWRGDEWLGATRAGIFVLAMGLLHWLAAWLYQRQFAMQSLPAKRPIAPTATDGAPSFLGVAGRYRNCVPAAICQQIVILLISVLMLDHGHMFRAAVAAAAAQLAMIAIIMFRRPSSPTPLDVALIRYSAVPLFLLAGALQGRFLELLDRH